MCVLRPHLRLFTPCCCAFVDWLMSLLGVSVCSYLLVFASMLACPDTTALPTRRPHGPSAGLSGGSIFVIIFFVCFGVYLIGGMLLTYRQEKQWFCPNRFFWSSVSENVGRGFEYLVYCGKSGGGGGGGGSLMSGGGASGPYAVGGVAASGSFGTVDPGKSYNAAPTAYTDL